MAARRSELVGLCVEDLTFTDEGLKVLVRRSKTDQEGQGAVLGVPHGRNRTTCPVRAVETWLVSSGITRGPLFRRLSRHGHVGIRTMSADAVATIVKSAVEEAGLDPDRYAGHSLRAGLVSEAARAGVEERVIAKQSRHRSMTILRGYIREQSVFLENAAAEVGL